jgi:hypothetical protein
LRLEPKGDDEIGLRAHLARDVAGEAAGDPDRERVVVEHAARQQRRRKQGAGLLGQFLDRRCRARAHHAAPREDDWTFGAP